MKGNNTGFTILEMAVVLVIVAMVSVGVFKGQELIDAYRNQKVIQEYQEYLSAFKSFQAKYQYLPGDFPNASRIWPDLQNKDPQLTYFDGNGDGNGIIDAPFKTGGLQGYVHFVEGVYAWGQLSREGLISGSYTGNVIGQCYKDGTGGVHTVTAPSNQCGGGGGQRNMGFNITAGINAPAAASTTGRPVCVQADISSSQDQGACQGKPLWIPAKFAYSDTAGTYQGTGEWGQVGNYFQILNDARYYGEGYANIFYSTPCRFLIAIDKKIDDGKPFTGGVLSEWLCRANRNGCEYGGCYTDTRDKWDYVTPNDADYNAETIPHFLISDNEL